MSSGCQQVVGHERTQDSDGGLENTDAAVDVEVAERMSDGVGWRGGVEGRWGAICSKNAVPVLTDPVRDAAVLGHIAKNLDRL
jgi:hypothetical protein